MICAVFGENRVTLRGHAGYAPPGEDIVCAAASALVFALIGALEEKGLLRELLAPAPYDGLYRHYVEAQIHYANGELERYNNAMALWNNGLMTLRDYWCREHLPRRQVQALRLC